MAKTGIFLVNLGTPDSPEVGDVRRYLREFLMDGRVIDIPAWQRFILVQGIIAPFRAFSSAKEYQKLWTDRGSPLLYHGLDLQKLLQDALGDAYIVAFGMRYQNPSIAVGLEALKDKGLEKIVVVPLYPQYASASTGSTIEKVLDEIKQWPTHPAIEVISQFFDHPQFIQTFTEIGQRFISETEYDHVVFTYHGLPERQILKSSVKGYCQLDKCCAKYGAQNRYCYRAQCFATTRLLVQSLGLEEGRYSTCFQSRLGRDPWIKPYTDELIPKLVESGVKKVLAFSPSFVADCLETTIEIGETYKEEFLEAGGEQWDLVPSLNIEPGWVACLKDLVEQGQSAVSLS